MVQDLFVPACDASSYTDPIVLAGPQYQLSAFSRVVPGLGAMALGIARSAIEALVNLASEKGMNERASR